MAVASLWKAAGVHTPTRFDLAMEQGRQSPLGTTADWGRGLA